MLDQPMYQLFAVAILFGYFGMLRISNITPSSLQFFDPTRHLVRGGITVLDSLLSINLK
jgi:hypothetical protein